MPIEIKFRMNGKEIKAAIRNRVAQLQERLEKRNGALDDFMSDPKKVRSFLLRNTVPNYGHGRQPGVLFSKDDISSEEKEEISQLCRRIFEIEQELHRLELIRFHLNDNQEFELPFEDLVKYGFDTSLEFE
jgi:hypothetical protein